MWVLKYIGGLIKNENNMIISIFFYDKTIQYEVMFEPNSYLQLFGSRRSVQMNTRMIKPSTAVLRSQNTTRLLNNSQSRSPNEIVIK